MAKRIKVTLKGLDNETIDMNKIFMDSVDNDREYVIQEITLDNDEIGNINHKVFDDGAPALKYFSRDRHKYIVPAGTYDAVVHWPQHYAYIYIESQKAWVEIDVDEDLDDDDPQFDPGDMDEDYEENDYEGMMDPGRDDEYDE